jgi:insulysin
MKKQPPQEWMFEEMKNMGDVNFRFKHKSPAIQFTRNVSVVMQKPPPRSWLLSGSAKLRRFNTDAIVKAMQYLRPDHFRLMIISQDAPVDFTQKERWYGTEYAVQRLPAELLAQLEGALRNGAKVRPEGLQLPHTNEFIPTRLDVKKKEVAEPAKAPKLIRNDDTMRLWWKRDDRFWVPKVNFLITIRSPMTYTTPAHSVMTRLFCELVKDSLSDTLMMRTFPASHTTLLVQR